MNKINLIGQMKVEKKVKEEKKLDWRRKLQKFNQKYIDTTFYVVPVLLLLPGFLHSNPTKFFESFIYCVAFLEIWILLASYIIWLVTEKIGKKLQNQKEFKPMVGKEIFGTTATVITVSAISSWSITQYRLGQEIAFSWKEYPTFSMAIIQFLIILIGSDFFTYWKHYFLHRPYMFAYHKYHHMFHNPSCFAGFSQHPIDALATFCPMYFATLTIVQINGYVYTFYILFFVHLNLYMHCGYSINFIEKIVSFLWINSSEYHNIHHETTHYNIGEVSPLFDYIMGTYKKKK